jgi:hypothetical protein
MGHADTSKECIEKGKKTTNPGVLAGRLGI